MVTIFAFFDGITGLAVLILGVIFGSIFVGRFLQTKKSLNLHVGIVLILLGSLYLGMTASFISLVVAGNPLDIILHGYLAYTVTPVAIIDAMYLGFRIFNPARTKLVVAVYMVIGIVYYIFWFGFPTEMIASTVVQPGDLPDISLLSVALGITVFYIASALIVLGGGFYLLQKKKVGEYQKYMRQITVGFVLFAIAAILDTAITSPLEAIARIIMIVAFWLLYRGFSGNRGKRKKQLKKFRA